MAVDDEGGISKNGSMPWPKNTEDLKQFKELTIDGVVIMGKLTWIDPKMPTPLKDRINVLVTSKSHTLYPGADEYISENLINNIKKISLKYEKKTKWVIGGTNLINQIFNLIDVFHLTRIYGKFNCDKKLDIEKITQNMKINKTIQSKDKTCHFQVWSRRKNTYLH